MNPVVLCMHQVSTFYVLLFLFNEFTGTYFSDIYSVVQYLVVLFLWFKVLTSIIITYKMDLMTR